MGESNTIKDNLFVEKKETQKTAIIHPSRLRGFSDAVFAMSATMIIFPLRKFPLKDDQTLREAILEKWLEFVIFVCGFLIICGIWETRFLRNRFVNKVDDILIAFSLFSFMVTLFAPFTIALGSEFKDYNISILLNSLILLVLEMTEAFIFIYSFKINPSLLSEQIRMLDPVELKVEKNQLALKFMVDILILILAAGLSFSYPLASKLLIPGILITPVLINIILKLTKCFNCCQRWQDQQSPIRLLTSSISKERLECFSDAAVAIIASMLMIDLRTEAFPTKDQVSEGGGLENVLSGMWKSFTAYVATYAVIAFMWFVNHSILHHVKVFNQKMIFVNKLFLAFVAYTPTAMKLGQKYLDKSSINSVMAIRFGACILFMAGLCNVLLLVTALLEKEATMYEWAWPKRGRDNKSNPVHTYLFLKTLILPSVSFFTFLLSLTTPYVCYVTFYVAVFLIPAIFGSLKIAYTCHCLKAQAGSTLLVGTPASNSHEDFGGLTGSRNDHHISLRSRRETESDCESD